MAGATDLEIADGLLAPAVPLRQIILYISPEIGRQLAQNTDHCQI